jgi:hypothetical protein
VTPSHPVLQAAVKALAALREEFDGRAARKVSNAAEAAAAAQAEASGAGSVARLSGAKARQQVTLLRQQVLMLAEKRKEEIAAKLGVQKQSWQRLIQGQAMEELTQQLMGEVSELDDANTRNEADLAKTRDTLAITHSKLVDKSEAYSRAKVALTRLTASEKAARADLKELKHSLAEAVVKLEFERVDLAKTKLIADKVPILQNELEAARLKNHYLERALRDTVTEMSGVRDMLTASEIEARKALMSVERLRDETCTLRSVVTDLEEEGKVKSDRLRTSQAMCGEVNLQLEVTEKQLSEAMKQVEALEAELAGAQSQYARMLKLYEEVRGRALLGLFNVCCNRSGSLQGDGLSLLFSLPYVFVVIFSFFISLFFLPVSLIPASRSGYSFLTPTFVVLIFLNRFAGGARSQVCRAGALQLQGSAQRRGRTVSARFQLYEQSRASWRCHSEQRGSLPGVL